MKTLNYILFFVLFALTVQSQDSIKKSPIVKFYSISLNGGYWGYDGAELLLLNDYKKLATKNILLQNFPAKDYESNGYSTSYNSGSGASLSTSLIFYNKSKKQYNNRYQLNFGLTYQSKDKEELGFRKTEQVRFDTLKSNTSSSMLFIDTVKRTDYTFEYSKDYLLINIGFSMHTKQNRILSFYSGLNISVGQAFNQKISSVYNYNEQFSDQNGQDYDYVQGSNYRKTIREISTIKNSNVFFANVPIGGLIRFSHTRKGFVTRFALNAELKAGVKVEQFIYKNSVSGFWNINFGIKFFLKRENILKSYRLIRPFY